MRRTFTVIADPGHAWLKVPIEAVRAVGLSEGHFSPYSYRRATYAGALTLYLEEDCDAAIFCEAYEKQFGEPIKQKVEHSNNRSRIRGYDSVRSNPALQKRQAA